MLEKIKSFFGFETKKHTYRITRVHKKQLAKRGFVFLIVGWKEYIGVIQIPQYLNDEDVKQVANALWKELKTKYKL